MTEVMAQPMAMMARSASSSPSSISYTFQVSEASQQTEQDNAAKHDRFAHTRTKRKRTSPEDYAILEAEYQVNAKPDRETRNSLADRVTLNEREIQVWFQNRRQMTRRKRHTWQPNEITSIIRSSQDLAKTMTSSCTTPDSSFEEASRVDEPQHVVFSSQESQTSVAGKEEDHIGTTESSGESTTSQKIQVVSEASPTLSSKELSQPKTLSAEAFTPRKLKRTSSTVRLAMSLDGKASVILRGQTPSPPNKPIHSDPLKRIGLQRSQSLVSASATASTQTDAPTLLIDIPRQPGRSRDTRNWEFWCSSERRESLTKSARLEQRGSAAGPLSLLRSASFKQTIAIPISKKRKSEEDLENYRPKLSRTRSSYARLQSIGNLQPDDNGGKKDDDPKKKGDPIYVDDEDDGSNKENIDPKTMRPAPPRAPAGPPGFGNRRQILQENITELSHSSSLGVLLVRERRTTSARTPSKKRLRTVASLDKENAGADTEVGVSMHPHTPTRGVEDLDAVQNLLRLRQGAWR